MKSLIFWLHLTSWLTDALITGNQDITGPNGELHTVRWSVDIDDAKSIEFTVFRNLSLTITDDDCSRDKLVELYNAAPQEWFSVAFFAGKRTMSGTDFLVVEAVSHESGASACRVSDSYGAGGPPSLDTDVGGKNDVVTTNAGLMFNNETSMLASFCSFKRPLDTSDAKYDLVISNTLINFGWAYGGIDTNGKLLQHVKTVGSMSINFWDGYTEPTKTPSRAQDLLFWHAVCMILAWFALMVPATFLARYFKTAVPTWFSFHWKLHALAVCLVVVGAILAISHAGFLFNDLHVIFGFAILSMLVAQVVFGYFSNALWFEGKPPAVWPDKIHWLTGRAVLLAGAANIVLGVVKYQQLMKESAPSATDLGWTMAYVSITVYVGVAVICVIFYELTLGQQHEYLALSDGQSDEEKETKQPVSFRFVKASTIILGIFAVSAVADLILSLGIA